MSARAFGKEMDVNSLINRSEQCPQKRADASVAETAGETVVDALVDSNIHVIIPSTEAELMSNEDLTMFVSAVSHLESEASWLFERMETMASELAAVTPVSFDNSLTTSNEMPDQAVEVTQPVQEDEIAAVEPSNFAQLTSDLQASRENESIIMDKLAVSENQRRLLEAKLQAAEEANARLQAALVESTTRAESAETEVKDLIALNDALCDAADRTEAEITKAGGILGVCKVRDELAVEVLTLRSEVGKLQATLTLTQQAAEATRVKLEHKVSSYKQVVSDSEEEMEALEKVVKCAAFMIESHLKVCRGEGGNLLALLLPQLQGVLSESTASGESNPEGDSECDSDADPEDDSSHDHEAVSSDDVQVTL